MEIKEEKLNLKVAQNHIINYIIGGIFAALLTGTAFYFNTNSTLNNHTTRFNSIDKRVESIEIKLNTISTEPIRIDHLEKEISGLREQQRYIIERQDKMFDILTDIKKNSSK